jgi:putative transposase
MPRIARIVIPNYPHHITQRGNYKQRVFTEKDDYRFYLKWLNKYSKKYSLKVLSYCLMPNHVHIAAIPGNEDSLAKTFNTSHMVYAHYFNNKNQITGHLWQGRFFSCVLDDSHLHSVIRYIENNPVRAGIVENPWEWQWSSAKQHALKEKDNLLTLTEIETFMDTGNWKDYLAQEEKEEVENNIRKNTLNGRPLGRDSFISKLEDSLGKRLRALPLGRPRKEV